MLKIMFLCVIKYNYLCALAIVCNELLAAYSKLFQT